MTYPDTSGLPVNVDATNADSGTDATVKAHQQHHDTVHAAVKSPVPGRAAWTVRVGGSIAGALATNGAPPVGTVGASSQVEDSSRLVHNMATAATVGSFAGEWVQLTEQAEMWRPGRFPALRAEFRLTSVLNVRAFVGLGYMVPEGVDADDPVVFFGQRKVYGGLQLSTPRGDTQFQFIANNYEQTLNPAGTQSRVSSGVTADTAWHVLEVAYAAGSWTFSLDGGSPVVIAKTAAASPALMLSYCIGISPQEAAVKNIQRDHSTVTWRI